MIHTLCMENVTHILNTLGNIVESTIIDDLLITLASDAVVRIYDVDTKNIITRISYPYQSVAAVNYAALVAKAAAHAV